jgi:ribulose 1,5-bisphosphate synthetase/thiazole synthase
MESGGSLNKSSLSGFLKGAPTFSASIVASTSFADIVGVSSLKRACGISCIWSPIEHQNQVSMRIDVNKFNTPVVSDVHLSLVLTIKSRTGTTRLYGMSC